MTIYHGWTCTWVDYNDGNGTGRCIGRLLIKGSHQSRRSYYSTVISGGIRRS